MVKVKVLEVDAERKRISLSMKTTTDEDFVESKPDRKTVKTPNKAKPQPIVQNSMANAFAKALKNSFTLQTRCWLQSQHLLDLHKRLSSAFYINSFT